MPKLTFTGLYNKRCNNEGVPHFWNPSPIKSTVPFTVFGTTKQCPEEWGVRLIMERMIALGLLLEVPVGQWVSDGLRREITRLKEHPEGHTAYLLLRSNVRDEGAHAKGFRYAAQAYAPRHEVIQESETIADAWLNNPEHPIAKACLAELRVFLCTLGAMRLFGGDGLAKMSEGIAFDEARHVRTGMLTLHTMGRNPNAVEPSLTKLTKDTLDWIFGDFSVAGKYFGEDYTFDKDFMIRSSDELATTGKAKQLDSTLQVSRHTLPFETSNAYYKERSTDVPNVAPEDDIPDPWA